MILFRTSVCFCISLADKYRRFFEESTSSTLERDVYKPLFLEARGWTVMRVWCRDFWLYPNKVIKAIADEAERSKAALKKAKK